MFLVFSPFSLWEKVRMRVVSSRKLTLFPHPNPLPEGEGALKQKRFFSVSSVTSVVNIFIF